jgi:hypothetical protein
VWVPGHHTWTGSQWRWISGTWQRPPNPNAQWLPGHYDPQTKRWTEGRWDVTSNARQPRAEERQ